MGSPLSKKHKISLYYFQMCVMARLKALGILRWNLGSDIKIHDLQSSAMGLINVITPHSVQKNSKKRKLSVQKEKIVCLQMS